MNDTVLHPYALLEEKEIHIQRASKGREYKCINPYCGGRMTPRQGEQNQWHFAHVHSSEGDSCSSESWLHATSKLLIARSFTSAKQSGIPYIATGWCPKCTDRISLDLADRFETVFTESNIIGEARPDLLFSTTKNYERFVIEVVVSHAPDSRALGTYDDISFPIGILTPSHKDIEHEWAAGVKLSHVIGPPDHKCRPPRRTHSAPYTITPEEFERRKRVCRFVEDSKGKPETDFWWCTTHAVRVTVPNRCSKRIMPNDVLSWGRRLATNTPEPAPLEDQSSLFIRAIQ